MNEENSAQISLVEQGKEVVAENAEIRAEEAENTPQEFTNKLDNTTRKRKRHNRRDKQIQNDPRDKIGYHMKAFQKYNEELFEFYKRQQVIPEEEWDSFKNILRVSLPSSFRIQRSLPERDLLLEYMKEQFFVPLQQIVDEQQQEGVKKPKTEENVEKALLDGQDGALKDQVEVDEEDMRVHVPEPIPFVPYAFQTSNSRTAVRSFPVLKNLHQFLVNETEIGNTSRQEAVSMVPPLLLDIQPHHLVLDACASPGSKTMQIIELMHEKSVNPEGLLVANDIEYSRCYLLVHQTLKRLPTANCVIVNQDASMMSAMLDSDGKPEFYDRILCDVICSGDGTFRKNPEMWSSWDVQKSLNLHKIQQSIAQRCLELLKVGGLMVYSTCSLNPIEDEAVVAHMLRKFAGKLELVDVSNQLVELKRSPGVSKWKVLSKGMEEFPTYSDVPANRKSNFVPSMFPPSREEAETMNLHRSFRILPHAQNSGGFFVAVLKKVGEFDGELRIDCPSKRSANVKKQRRRFREDPFVFLDRAAGQQLIGELNQHYGVDHFSVDNLLLRTSNTELKKAVYYVNDRLKRFLHANAERFRVVNAGVGILRKVDKISPCGYRLMQDGLRIMAPYITKRVVDLDAKTLILILQGADDQHYVPLGKLEPEFRDKFKVLACGSVVLRCSTTTDPRFKPQICAWMGANTVTAFVSREEKIHTLWMLGADASKLCKDTQSVRQSRAAWGTRNGEPSVDGEDEQVPPVVDEIADIKMEDEEESMET